MDAGRSQLLLTLLADGAYHTAAELSRSMGLSERSVRWVAHQLKEPLAESGAHLEAKPHVGFRLVVDDEEHFRALISASQVPSAIPQGRKERAEFIMVNLLFQQDYVKRDSLSELFFVSTASISAALKTAEETLNEYNLTLDRRPNRGIRVVGAEQDKRRLLVRLSENPSVFRPSVGVDIASEVDALIDLITPSFAYEGIELSEASMRWFATVCFVAEWRAFGGFALEPSTPVLEELYVYPFQKRAIAAVLELMQTFYSFERAEAEASFLSYCLANACFMDGMPAEVPQDSRVYGNACMLAARIRERYGVDLAADEYFMSLLVQHLAALDIRLQIGIPRRDDQYGAVPALFPMAYEMAALAEPLVHLPSAYRMHSDEIASLALVMQFGLERVGYTGTLRTALYCPEGRGVARIYAGRLQRSYCTAVAQVQACITLKELAALPEEVRVIFTTVPLAETFGRVVIQVRQPISELEALKVLVDSAK